MFPSLRDPETRDTDADWREIGGSEPYWGVITDPKFRRAALTTEQIADFYRSGRDHIEFVASELRQLAGGAFDPKSALDFGCGAGRLTEAMTDICPNVVGVDISPGMLEEAKRNSTGRASYRLDVPDGAFDWVNSYIVFQHMPPARGMPLFDRLLGQVAPGGFASLHVTISRNTPTGVRGALASLRELIDRWSAPRGVMLMYDYDLTRICAAFARNNMRKLVLHYTDHGGHYGVLVFARRGPA
jgi:SAM-dependent methyltransferase